MSPIHKDTTRYLYCGFCHQYYAGMSNNLEKVESPFTVNLSNKVEDPIRTNCPPHIASPDGKYCLDCGIQLIR